MARHHVGDISIFKQSGSPFWTAYYRDNAGHQRKKSLKTKNLNLARERARAIDKLLQDGDEGRLDALQRNRTITFGEVIERFLGERPDGPRGAGASWADTTKHSTAPLIKKLKCAWETRSIATLRYADILEFLGTHTHTKQKSSWNRYRAIIRGIFKFAVENEYISRSPADQLAFQKPPKRKPKALTDEEYQAVYQHLPRYAQIIVQILVETGVRRSQLFRIEWRDVDTVNRALTIRDPKDGEDMLLPIMEQTAQLFDSLRPGSQWKQPIGKSYKMLYWPSDSTPTDTVIPTIDIKRSLYKAAANAKLGEGRTVTPHMFRHTWATRLRRAGVGLDRLMELGGWDSYEMVLKYADVPQDLRESMDSLKDFPSHGKVDHS